MSEPIVIYDPDGAEVVVHGGGQANVLVEQQGFTWQPPAPPPDAADAPQSPAPDDAPPPTGPKRKGRS